MSERISVRVSEWLDSRPQASFDSWKAGSQAKGAEVSSMSKEDLHRFRIMEKYGTIWRDKVKKGEEGDREIIQPFILPSFFP